MVKVAIIGFGGIVHSTHLKAHMNLVAKGATKLVAVCDVCPEKFEENATHQPSRILLLKEDNEILTIRD